jgi:hypothetical protein
MAMTTDYPSKQPVEEVRKEYTPQNNKSANNEKE